MLELLSLSLYVCVCICFSKKKKKKKKNTVFKHPKLKNVIQTLLIKHSCQTLFFFSFFGYNFQYINIENVCLSLHINQALYTSVNKFTIGVKYNYFFLLILFVATPLDTFTFPSNKFIFGVN